jgi:hypothetical protein
MKLQVNSYIKRDDWENFVSGQVFFQSVVSNKEAKDLPDSLRVNLSKSGNPQCDTPIRHLQAHNNHAGMFTSYTLMREYINRVVEDVQDAVKSYNLDLQEYQETKNELKFPIIEDNDDLVPTPKEVPPPGMVLFDLDKMEAIHDLLFGDAELVYEEELDLDEDED